MTAGRKAYLIVSLALIPLGYPAAGVAGLIAFGIAFTIEARGRRPDRSNVGGADQQV